MLETVVKGDSFTHSLTHCRFQLHFEVVCTTRVLTFLIRFHFSFHCIITLIIATLPAEADLAQVQAAQKKRGRDFARGPGGSGQCLLSALGRDWMSMLSQLKRGSQCSLVRQQQQQQFLLTDQRHHFSTVSQLIRAISISILGVTL